MPENNTPCEKVIRLEAKVEELEKRFDNMPELIARITTTLEYQIEAAKKRDILDQEQNATLARISTNMEVQTKTMERLNEKLDESNRNLTIKIDETSKKVCDLDLKIQKSKEAIENEKKTEAKRWSFHIGDIIRYLIVLIAGAFGSKLITSLMDMFTKSTS